MDKPYIKTLNNLEEQKDFFSNFSENYEKILSENSSGILKIIHPPNYHPVKKGFCEKDINELSPQKIKKLYKNIFRKLQDGAFQAEFKPLKGMKISELVKLSKSEDYKAPDYSLENLEDMYWNSTWKNPPPYASNVVMSLIKSEDFNHGQLKTLLRYVQKVG